MILELRPTAVFPTGWNWGMDNEAFTRWAPITTLSLRVTTASRVSCIQMPSWEATSATRGILRCRFISRTRAGVHFVNNQFWRLIVFGNNPKGGPQVGRLIRNAREWAGGRDLAAVAMLHNQNALQLIWPANRPKRSSAECALLDRLSHQQDVDMILAGAVEYFGNYKVLLAPPYSLRGMPPERYTALREYVRNGGTLITMSQWNRISSGFDGGGGSIGRADGVRVQGGKRKHLAGRRR